MITCRLDTRKESDGSKKVCAPSTTDKETRKPVAVAVEKGEKKNNRNVSTDTRESNSREKVIRNKQSEFTGSTDTLSVQRGSVASQSPGNETSEVPSMNTVSKVFDSPPWSRQSILGLDLSEAANTSLTSSTDVDGSTTLQRPVTDANQPKTLPKALPSRSTLSEQTGQESVSGASKKASSSLESEARVSENEVVEKRGPKHKNR